MRIWLPLGLIIAGAATVATVVFAGERLWFEAHALVMRPANPAIDAGYSAPEVTIQCDKADCHAGSIFYEVIVDATGRPRAIRTKGEYQFESSTRARAAKAALAARWPASESGRPFRAFQVVLSVPPERRPTRHLPFPDTEGQPVSITFERGGIYNPRGRYFVTLNSDGGVEFCGQPNFVKAPGSHQSRISDAAFEALVRKFRDADFFSLDDHYVSLTAEGVDDYLRVRIGDQEKTVMDADGREVGMPAVIRSLQKAVDEAAETSQWVGSPEEWVSSPEAVTCPTGPREKALQALLASRRAAGL